MGTKRVKRYVRPSADVVILEMSQMIATSTNVTVGGWGNGGHLGDYELE